MAKLTGKVMDELKECGFVPKEITVKESALGNSYRDKKKIVMVTPKGEVFIANLVLGGTTLHPKTKMAVSPKCGGIHHKVIDCLAEIAM
jgi:hypothetical protein